MKFCEIGVYHHDCWFTDAITQFPTLQVKELSGRTVSGNSKSRIVKGLYRLISPESEMFRNFVRHIGRSGKVLEITPIEMGNDPLVHVTWKAPVTSYDAVLQSGCVISSPCYSRDGYEGYKIFAQEPNNIKKLLSELEQIGEVKMFATKNCQTKFSKNSKFSLTKKQKQAVASAISLGYYEWPKKVNLEELAGRLGVKRRALQENLRKAEAKILPNLLDELTND
ncbi:helix-turn-helix domain-containing protein [Candidatus Micrarchaeota archaeon]|nr:helix-turn-helix domain-containing protein [Candidatus Micrarchaeota archaeon]